MKKTTIALMLVFSIFILSCSNDKDTEKKEEVTEDVKKEFDCDNFHWGYEGDEAAVNWANCYSDCGGKSQSPVNISGVVEDTELLPFETDYEQVATLLANNGHSLQFEYPVGSALTFKGEKYDLLQFHFHTGSEHTVEGKQYPMEVHLVHQNTSTGNILVVGVLYTEGNENSFLQKFIDNLPAKDKVYKSENQINANELLPENEAYYTYQGSLTTPPCSEIVTWVVMQEPVEASAEQIEKMHKVMHNNFRPVQELNGREIKSFN